MDAINTIEDDTVRRELHYCVQKCEYWSGYSIRTDSIAYAIFDMIQIKKIAEKEDGKQLYHMLISIWRYYAKPIYKNEAVIEAAIFHRIQKLKLYPKKTKKWSDQVIQDICIIVMLVLQYMQR